MALSIGNYKITYGDDNSNWFYTNATPQAFFGKGSFDRFIFYGNNVKTINGKDWNIPHIASGGIGNDYYSIHIGSSAIIIDNGNPSPEIDRLFWRGSALSSYAYSVDDRHIALVDIKNNSSALIIDGLNDRGRIEELWIDGSWIDVSSNQISDYLKTYNYSLEELIDMEILHPPAIGLSDANSVRDKIQEVYEANKAPMVNTYARNLLTARTLRGSQQFQWNSFEAKFFNLGEDRYGIQMQKQGQTSIDEITGVTSLQFEDQALNVASDIAATFDQVKGIDDVSGVVFRLYNAAFARLPDAKGLKNWINGNSSGGMTYATSAQEFSSSQEFKNRYGANTTDTQYITTLYNNVLERSPDAAGLANYQNLLANGKERGALLLDFSESPENRVLFTQVTGLS